MKLKICLFFALLSLNFYKSQSLNYKLIEKINNTEYIYYDTVLIDGYGFKKLEKEKIEHNHQRVYYITRNSLYLAKKYGNIFPSEFGFFKTLNILFIHEIIKILLYEDNKIIKIKSKILGLYHFLINKYGRYDLNDRF
jgi:hypothetical protein